MSDGAIRPAGAGDAATIDALLLAAFASSAEARLVAQIRADGDDAIALVHETGGAADGYCLASPMRRPAGGLGLGPLAVAADRRGAGIGTALVAAVIEAARAGDWQALFVLGDPGFYSRFGFSVAAADRFSHGWPKEYFQVLELVPGAAATLPPAIDYASAFDRLAD